MEAPRMSMPTWLLLSAVLVPRALGLRHDSQCLPNLAFHLHDLSLSRGFLFALITDMATGQSPHSEYA